MTCPTISNEENVKWDETIANGEVIHGECLEVGYGGPISRVCIQNGTIGNWGNVFGSCQGWFFFFFTFLLSF